MAVQRLKGREYCGGEKGWGVYDERPLRPILLRYAVNDVERSKINRVSLNFFLHWSDLRVLLSYWKFFQEHLMDLNSLLRIQKLLLEREKFLDEVLHPLCSRKFASKKRKHRLTCGDFKYSQEVCGLELG